MVATFPSTLFATAMDACSASGSGGVAASVKKGAGGSDVFALGGSGGHIYFVSSRQVRKTTASHRPSLHAYTHVAA